MDERLDRQAEISVLSGLQFQGDVAVVPVTRDPSRTPIPASGVPVVRGQDQANTRLRVETGPAFFTPDRSGRALVLGLLTVEESATAYLAHPEHAFTGIAPGTYELRRQREQAGQVRLVAD
ncbi:hypothetical protein GCM10009850_042190 [Nonomuraea monospora]|uniref:Uncharacterized protein n=1 Tax=Nonomuraea monospora TaxID=568818 RepID=A0ABN3CHP4_9ACTN